MDNIQKIQQLKNLLSRDKSIIQEYVKSSNNLGNYGYGMLGKMEYIELLERYIKELEL
jgi:hypothetical protein